VPRPERLRLRLRYSGAYFGFPDEVLRGRIRAELGREACEAFFQGWSVFLDLLGVLLGQCLRKKKNVMKTLHAFITTIKC
jgi:hypothetical protein